ncbi:amino acid permease [Chloropicon primus]|uniref:Amino acid permease n=1 Tax=Chloropicon primus TaxID=1764295 RepID=A0A5B8MGN2_9CHLO|nr:amino acid permease [Chloropicon primus]UPQ98828.1 amino acid permease [Chloropicon primus]|eukprot:QDZ19616.1 amino acid permease [Chloropicon primus]
MDGEALAGVSDQQQPLLRSRSSSLTDVCAGDDKGGEGAQTVVYASRKQTFMNVLKGNVGPGCLSLPFAFSQAGSLLGPLGFFILSSMAVYNMHLLIQCRERLKVDGRFARTYGEVAGHVLGKSGKPLVDTFIVLTQLGICSVYFSFFGDSFPSEDLFGKDNEIPYAYMAALAFPVVLLLIVPNQVKSLAVFSGMSNLLICSSILWVLVESVRHAVADNFDAVKKLPLCRSEFPLFVGNSVYSLEGIGLVLPIGNSMRSTKEFRKVFFPGIITACTILWLMGTLSYYSFGKISDGSITAELDKRGVASNAWMIVINIFLCAAVLLTYPLQLRPAAEVIAERVLGSPAGTSGPYYGRLALAIFTGGLAIAMGNNLGLMIALIGSGASTMLALILPPLLDILDTTHKCRWPRLCFHASLVTLGAVLACLGVFVSGKALF